MNKSSRRKAKAIRTASKSGDTEKFGTSVPFGRCVNSSEARRQSGKKPYNAPTRNK